MNIREMDNAAVWEVSMDIFDTFAPLLKSTGAKTEYSVLS